jgi:PAS domain S-box-containing protein
MSLLSTLIVQNPGIDTSILVQPLQEAGFILDWQIVTTESEYLNQLERGWDLILVMWVRLEPLSNADFAQYPPLEPLPALEKIAQRNYQIPVIIITDNPSVELAVTCMKKGASDYLLPEQIPQLGSKVKQVLSTRLQGRKKLTNLPQDPFVKNSDRSDSYHNYHGDRRIPGQKPLTTVTKIKPDRASNAIGVFPQSFFQELVEHNSDLIWEVDHNAIYTYVSPNIKTILGYEPQELIGKTPFDFMLTADGLRVAEVWGSLASKQLPFICLEHRTCHKNGQEIMLESSGIPIIDTCLELGIEKKIFRGYRGISRNIHFRFQQEKLIEDLIRETASVTGEGFFKSLVQSLAKVLEVDYVFVGELMDDTHRIRILACLDSQLGNNFDYNFINSPCEITLKYGEYYCYKSLLETFKNSPNIQKLKACSYLGSRLVDPAGNAVGTLCVFSRKPICINRQKKVVFNIFALRASAELQRQRSEKERTQLLESIQSNEAKYRAIFSASPIGMATFNLETLTLSTANPKFCQILEYQESELQKLTLQEITHPDDFARERNNLSLLKSGELSIYELEKRYVKKTGESLPCDLTCTALGDVKEKTRLGLVIVQDISEWKQVEESVRLRDRAITASTNGIAISDARYPSLPIIYVNPAFEKITGYSAVDVLGQSSWWLVNHYEGHPEWIAERLGERRGLVSKPLPPQKQLQDAVQQQSHCSVVMQNYRQDGTPFWNQLSVSPIYDSTGNLTHFLSIHHDITEIEETQCFLRLSQERLRYLVASNPAVIYSRQASAEYNITFMSENIVSLFGYESNHFFTDPDFWKNHIHPEDAQGISLASEKLLNQGYEVQEYRFCHADGRYIWVRDEQKLIRDEQDNPLEIIGYWADISDRKEAEAALKIAKDKLQAVWDAVPGFVSLISSDLKYIGVNQQLAHVFRLSPEQFIGKEIGFLGTSQGFIHFITEFFASDLQEDTQEITSGVEPNQKTHLIVVKKYQQGTAAVLIGIDITERKQAETKIQASLQEKEVLLKEIHHRVKNNLQVISSLLKMQSRSLNDPKILEMFQESQSRIHSMALIHEKLYQSEDLARINCADYIHNLTSHLYRSYQVSPRNIQLDVTVDNISLSIDAALPCGLIINELVSNALKYAFPKKRSGNIYIHLTMDEQKHYILKVGDNGIGLPENIDWQNTRSLGLRLVRTLSQQLGSTVELDRSHGTMFLLTFREPNYKQRI